MLSVQPSRQLAVALSPYGLAAPSRVEEAERLLIRFESAMDRGHHSAKLSVLISLLRELVATLAIEDLATDVRHLQ